jgi:hypothetical protein
MYCDSNPKGKRISAPATIGTDSIKPFWAGLRLNVSEMNGAIAPFKTQMQQEKEKYKNAANNVGEWPLFKNPRKKPKNPAMVHIQSNFDSFV